MSAISKTHRVRFAPEEVSAVFVVPRKTESEAMTLFYQPEDCDRFRGEAQLEKLAAELGMDIQNTMESLNDLSQLARYQFKGLPAMPVAPIAYGASIPPAARPHSSSPRGAKGTARIA
ncbi:expressed unknown protein [Seminavis robusta]|uniref:Uncharacterized protein n=1 Tax=Seminavis robusta TaxID=568900 RepID=A0A9N8HBB9_9STRA|nr:expressed unknown protein [Seminavis robusta]|eukprot:Sro255_g100480.1 n/a (118) ;mRNA; r:74222-74575